MLHIENLYLNYGKMKPYGESRFPVSETLTPCLSWSAISSVGNDRQTAYRVIVKEGNRQILDTDMIEDGKQQYTFEKPLPEGCFLDVTVTVQNTAGEISAPLTQRFLCTTGENWAGKWISHPQPRHERPVEFVKTYHKTKAIANAVLYVCGVGYHCVKINGDCPDYLSYLDPATANYEKSCYFTVLDVTDYLDAKENALSVTVADGWRFNNTDMFEKVFSGRPIEFYGDIALTAYMDIVYEDGTRETVPTDDTWQCRYDRVTEVSIFKGETYDARIDEPFVGAVLCNGPAGVLRPMTVEPITAHRQYLPESVYETEAGIYILDFGQNMAGVPTLKIPRGMQAGDKITMRFGEMLDFDGNLYNEPLRDAPQTDTYISDGKDMGDMEWTPSFTYHGFRYCEVKGYPGYTGRDEVTVSSVYTDIDKESDFRCGSALVTKLHQNCVMTERSNIHSILTDCPQRDERMGWMNDATVRFQETPYNFDVGHIFPKVAQDIHDEQRPDGAFTCCAPFIYGAYPADPVCSSYLITGVSSLLHNGNIAMIARFFDGFAAWENSLLSRSDDYIVNYSYYGDWAGPADACGGSEYAVSLATPGIFMSTGYSYFNAKTLSEMAALLGRKDDAEKWRTTADAIRNAMLAKWFDYDSGKFATGSQGCQAFALWLGIVPEEKCVLAAQVMRGDLVNNHYKFTTGNLCTRYLMDMLAKYGYVDDAWEVLSSETYPSYGYMIQNEATTVWERFELKREPGMNSHNHPMYASVDYWFYAYLCGVQPQTPGFETFTVKPYYPQKLLSAECTVDTVRGKIHVRWVKKLGKRCLYVTVPFGTTATVYTDDTHYETVGSGCHTYICDL